MQYLSLPPWANVIKLLTWQFTVIPRQLPRKYRFITMNDSITIAWGQITTVKVLKHWPLVV
jgi:hypothetical protein